MAIELGDDGTMDTVIYCTECGHEFRFNYDPQYQRDDEPTEQEAATAYSMWIDECIEQVKAEHKCGPSIDIHYEDW